MAFYLGYMNYFERIGNPTVYHFYPTHKYVNKRFEDIQESQEEFPDYVPTVSIIFVLFSIKK